MRHARLVIGSILLAAAAVVSASCGARSSLEVSAAASGSTGGGPAGSGGGVIVVSASSSSTSGSGGGGHDGSGGAACGFGGAGIGGTPVVDACAAIAPQASILAIGDGNGVEDVGPTLVHLADTAPTVGAIYLEEFKAFQSSARVTAFDAWGAWPPTASPPASIEDAHGHLISPELGLLAAELAPSDGRAFSLLYTVFSPTKQRLYAAEVLGVDACGRAGSKTRLLGTDRSPLSLVPTPDRLGAFDLLSRFESPYFTVDGSFTTSDGGFENLFDLGCATTPVSAAAVTTATGWIFGIAAGTPFDGQKLGCNEKPGPIGSTTYLTFAVLDQAPQPPGTEQLRPNGSLQASGMITSLAFVPTSDGARAIWGVGAALSTATLDATAAILTTGSLDMGVVPIDASAIDAAPLGAGFAVAAPTSAASIHVGLFDATGALVGSADVPLGGAVNGRLRALASPAGDKLLVAWSQQAPDADATLHVARFDCVSP